MSERLVIVIEYAVDPDAQTQQPLNEAMKQLQQHLDDWRQPHIRPLHFHAAIKDDADQVLAVFDKEER